VFKVSLRDFQQALQLMAFGRSARPAKTSSQDRKMEKRQIDLFFKFIHYLCTMREEEHLIQSACVRWFKYQYPQYIIFAVPNGGWRNVVVAKKLKAEGVLAGVSDLVILAPHRTIFIEMKKNKGGVQGEAQKSFQANVNRLGFEYYLCKGFDEFMSVVTQLLGRRDSRET